MLATTDRRRCRPCRVTGEDEPLPHVGADHVEPLVAVEIDEATCDTAGVPGISGIAIVCRANWTR